MATTVMRTYIAIILTYTFATICLILRVATRRINQLGFWLDDYFAVLSWVFATAWNSLLLIWIFYGFGQHIDQLLYPKSIVLYYSRLLNWNLDLFYAFSLGCSKLSLLSLYWRLFGITNIRNPIRWMAGCVVIWIIVRTFLTIFMCIPIQGFWDKTIESICNINEQKFFFGSTFPHLLLDIAILCLPIWQISKLHLESLQKIGLYITFAFGIFVCTASVIVLIPAFHYSEQSDDITWNNVSMFIWATVEVNLAVVAGSFPMIRGVVVRLFKGYATSKQARQDNLSSYPPNVPSHNYYRMSIFSPSSRYADRESQVDLV